MAGDDRLESAHQSGNGRSDVHLNKVLGETQDSARKKKKKKKKRKGPGDGATNLKPTLPPRKELEARFTQALLDLRRDDPECVWTHLDNCNIHDAKASSLAAALENTTELTSLDLSGNSISSRGVESLAKALEDGAAPQLILLDLRGNPLGAGSESVVERLKKTRRELKVDISSAPPGSTGQDLVADPDGHEMLEVKAAPRKPHDWLHWMDPNSSKAANDDAWSETTSEKGPSDEESSSTCWAQIVASLEEEPVDLQEVSTNLRTVSLGVRKEMTEAKAPLPNRTKLDQLRPFTYKTVKHLAELASILDFTAAPLLTPYSKDTPVPALGLHCALVSQIVEQLLCAVCASINVHILKAGLIPRLTYMAFEFPKNNVLQAATSRAIRWALQSGLSLLWEPLFKPRMGLSKGSNLRKGNLVERLGAILGRSAKAQTVGQRECDVGFACSVAGSLLTAAESDSQLMQGIKDSKGWEELKSEEGVLQKLLAEQNEELCGPRPERTTLGQIGGGSMNGHNDFQPALQTSDFMQLLQQSIEGSHIQDPSEGDADDDSEEESDETIGQE